MKVATNILLWVTILSLNANAQGKKVIENSIGMKLAPIPAGEFIMGSPRKEADRDSKEQRHPVSITKPFYMGVFEVRQREYQTVTGENRSVFKDPDNPVENIEWQKAKKFCSALSARPQEKAAGRTYRLPTEAEWEYACRAGTKTAYHFGDKLTSEMANFNGNYPTKGSKKGDYVRGSTRVGLYPPNAFGLHDMHGNVSEWCQDWYDPNYYDDSPEEDPLGPPLGAVKTPFKNAQKNFFVVVRGGNWVDDARALRSAYRFRAMPNTQYRIIGFRVVCEVKK